MVIGAGEFLGESGAYGFMSSLRNNARGVTLGLTSAHLLKENMTSNIYNNNELTFGTGSFCEGRHNNQIKAGTEFHYTTTANQGGVFFDTSVGADVGFNNSYSQDINYELAVGPHISTRIDSQGNYYLTGGCGPYLQNQSSERTNHERTFDAALSAGLATGISGLDCNTYVFGKVNQEVTHHRNTSISTGIGHTREIDFFGADAVLQVKAGYNFNVSGNTTNDLSKHSGGFAECGIMINI